jgi:hypothetical protein
MNIKLSECGVPCDDCSAEASCNQDPGNIIGKTLTLLMELDLWWGHSRFGLILSSAHFNNTPVTTEHMADLTGFSNETVRRHIKPLINVERVIVVKEGRNVSYRAHPDWAMKTRRLLMKTRDEVNVALGSGPPPEQWVFPKRLVPFELTMVNDNGTIETLDLTPPGSSGFLTGTTGGMD